jgi:hypothetical protein
VQSRLKLLLAACILTIVAGGIALVWSLHASAAQDEFWRSHVPTIVQYAVAPIIGLFGWTIQQLIASRPRQSTPDQLQDAKQALVGRGNEWWRGIPQPAWPGHVLRAGLSPLEVTWTGTADGQPVSGRTSDVTELARRFRQARPFRLAIQGPSGSGKSVFARLLMAELLKTADSGPVPVFLPLWSWDPGQEPLNAWIKRRMTEDYPELGDHSTFGPTAVANLVDQGLILPILDGLDALPRPWHAKVFADGGLMSQDRLVLTCRTEQPDREDGFTVIKPKAVRTGEACRFLAAVTRKSVNKWAEQAGDFRFAILYSEPRLIYMASAICARTGWSPEKFSGELAEEPHEPVLQKLPSLLIEAAFPKDGPAAQDYPWYYRDPARSWLERLAPLGLVMDVDLRRPEPPAVHPPPAPGPVTSQPPADLGVSCIAWWNLHRGVRFLDQHQAWLRGAVAGSLAFLVMYLSFLLDRSWHYAAFTAGNYAAMVFFAAFFLADDPTQPRVKLWAKVWAKVWAKLRVKRKDKPAPAGSSKQKHPALAWWISQSWPRWRPLILAGGSTMIVAGLLLGIRAATIHSGSSDYWLWAGFRTKLFPGPNIKLIHPPRRIWYWTGTKTGLIDGFNNALVVVLTCVIARVPRPPRGIWALGSGPVGRPETANFLGALIIGILYGLQYGATSVLKAQHPGLTTFDENLVTGLITGIDFALGAWLFHWSGTWARPERAPDPLSAARADLTGALLRPLILATTFAFAFGISPPFDFTGVDVWVWFVVGLAIGALETEWPLYFVAIRTLRGRHQRIPIRLMRFLETCRVAGLLASAGQAYQIRDDGLLEQLTRRPSDEAPEVRSQADRRPVTVVTTPAPSGSSISNGAAAPS